MSVYTTKTDAIEQYIEPALGDFVHDFDTDGIFNDFFTFDQSEGGFVPAMPEEEFYSIAEKHDIGEASLATEAHAAREASIALDSPSSLDRSEPQRE